MIEKTTPAITPEHRGFTTKHPRAALSLGATGLALTAALTAGGVGELMTGDPLIAARSLIDRDHSCSRSPDAINRVNLVLNDSHNRDSGGEGFSGNYRPIAFARGLGLHLESSDRAIRSLKKQTTAQGALNAINSYTVPNHHVKFTAPTNPGPLERIRDMSSGGVTYYKPGEVPVAELRKDGNALLANLSETPTELSTLSGVTKVAIVKALGKLENGQSRYAGRASDTSSTLKVLLTPQRNEFIINFTHERAHKFFQNNCGGIQADIKEYETFNGRKIHYTGQDNNPKLKPKEAYSDSYAKKSKGENEAEGQAGLTDGINQPPLDHSDATRGQAKAQLEILESIDGGRGVGQYYAYLNANLIAPKS